jgi:hypothetical protein
MVDVFWGVVSLLCAAVLFWRAFTSKEFYAATLHPSKNSWQYSLWGGRIVSALVGIICTFVGIMAIREGLSGK